jgi:hypothetical protein
VIGKAVGVTGSIAAAITLLVAVGSIAIEFATLTIGGSADCADSSPTAPIRIRPLTRIKAPSRSFCVAVSFMTSSDYSRDKEKVESGK